MTQKIILRKIWFWLVVLMALYALFGCKTKTVTKSNEKTESKTEIQSEIKETKIDSTIQKVIEEKATISEDSQTLLSELVDITAEVTADTPFTFTTTKNGLPEKVVTVTGNATVQIKTITDQQANKSEKSESKIQENKQFTVVDYFKKADRTAAAKSQSSSKNSNVKVKNGTFGTWTFLGFSFVVVAILLWLWFYLKKKN